MPAIKGFHEVQFPKDISYGAVGGPGYSTDIATTKAGFEQRNINWSESRCKYNVSHGVKTESQITKLLTFFRARRGRAYGFRYKDWSDFQVVNQEIGVGDGTTRTFQLIKTYTDDAGYSETRVITKPVANTVHLYVGKQFTSAVTVDYTTGKVTLAVAPPLGTKVYADCEFDVPCRFDTDNMDINIKEWNNYEWSSIPVVEVKV